MSAIGPRGQSRGNCDRHSALIGRLGVPNIGEEFNARSKHLNCSSCLVFVELRGLYCSPSSHKNWRDEHLVSSEHN